MEHIFAIRVIVQNAIDSGLPLAMTFLNPENAFESISHQLILDVLNYCNFIPSQFVNYIFSLFKAVCLATFRRKTGHPYHSKWKEGSFRETRYLH